MAIILTLCLITVPQTQLSDISNIDKYVHAFMFMVLTLILWAESLLQSTSRYRETIPFGGIGGTTLFFGGAIEILQSTLTSNRSGDWMDFLADAVGVALGELFGYVLLQCRNHRSSNASKS